MRELVIFANRLTETAYREPVYNRLTVRNELVELLYRFLPMCLWVFYYCIKTRAYLHKSKTFNQIDIIKSYVT